MIIWIIGLGGSGKTSLAKRLYKTAKPKTDNLVLLDNPEIRNLFGGSDDKKFTPKIRRKLTNRLQKICQLLDRNKINAICSILCPFEDIRRKNRKLFSKYYEIFLDAKIDIVKKRKASLYSTKSKWAKTPKVGIEIPFEEPRRPDLILNSNIKIDFSKTANKIYQTIRTKLL